MGLRLSDKLEKEVGKELYGYQKESIEQIFQRLNEYKEGYNLLYQLPTGGGKTVIFSEIAKQYVLENNKKVLILTHRIELSVQTSNMLKEFGVENMVINSHVKTLSEKDNYPCYVAMVETLNNRLEDKVFNMDDIGLVIVDEAHYNSFRKLFKYFEKSLILGVTATPLSSNIKLPLNDIYDELIVGNSITSLIEKKFLAKASIYGYNIALGTLKVGMNGDYTVKSSERLYNNDFMQEKLLHAYKERALGTKTLIFNNGIKTSEYVHRLFTHAGLEIKHLDNRNTEKERKEILKWFKEKPNAILTSVSILTTGFDEPSVETIILNRATKSLTLYHQMIGRGSRILPNKHEFNVIDLGNNAKRFGLWNTPVDWNHIFKYPNYYLETLVSDEEIESNFVYEMPADLKEKFKNSDDIDFDVKEVYKEVTNKFLKPKTTLERSVEQHVNMCVENSEDYDEAFDLALLLGEDIKHRVKMYSRCICKSTDNYLEWLEEDYYNKLKTELSQRFF